MAWLKPTTQSCAKYFAHIANTFSLTHKFRVANKTAAFFSCLTTWPLPPNHRHKVPNSLSGVFEASLRIGYGHFRPGRWFGVNSSECSIFKITALNQDFFCLLAAHDLTLSTLTRVAARKIAGDYNNDNSIIKANHTFFFFLSAGNLFFVCISTRGFQTNSTRS